MTRREWLQSIALGIAPLALALKSGFTMAPTLYQLYVSPKRVGLAEAIVRESCDGDVRFQVVMNDRFTDDDTWFIVKSK